MLPLNFQEKHLVLQIICLGLTVKATVYLFIPIRKLKNVWKLLFTGSNATGIFALYDISQPFG